MRNLELKARCPDPALLDELAARAVAGGAVFVRAMGQRDTYFTAHAHNTRGIRNGLEAGVACFEHGTFLDEETAAAMAAAGAYLVPTFAVTRLFVECAEAWGIPQRVLPRMAGNGFGQSGMGAPGSVAITGHGHLRESVSVDRRSGPPRSPTR